MKEETRQMVRFSKDVSRMRQEKQENKQQMCPDMFFCFPLAFFPPPKNISRISSPLNRNLEGKFDIILGIVKLLCVAVTGVLFLHSFMKPTYNVAGL